MRPEWALLYIPLSLERESLLAKGGEGGGHERHARRNAVEFVGKKAPGRTYACVTCHVLWGVLSSDSQNALSLPLSLSLLSSNSPFFTQTFRIITWSWWRLTRIGLVLSWRILIVNSHAVSWLFCCSSPLPMDSFQIIVLRLCPGRSLQHLQVPPKLMDF